MQSRLPICFIWHMHQPLYKDMLTGRYHLPWVRLHSTCSYLDMVSVLDEFPEVSGTFNLTPSLLWQLEDIASSDDLDDPFLALSVKPAEELSPEEKVFILRNFFSAHTRGEKSFNKRYNQLLFRRGPKIDEASLLKRAKDFSTRDYRDLQTYFNLAWCGFTLREREARCRDLIDKASGYSESEKCALIELQLETVREIVPLYRKKQQEKRIEISTTPYYHPILPLLCGDVGHEEFAADAACHVRRAVEYYKRIFGSVPEGMWPAEGAVSAEALDLLASEGVKWTASCEGVLKETLKDKYTPDAVYELYNLRQGSRGIDMLFRHEGLSNAISFNYSALPAEQAVEDFTAALKRDSEHWGLEPSNKAATLILDGENPWPYYPEMGKDFLRCLYRKLSSSEEFVTETVSERISLSPARKELSNIHSGSWIRRDFSKWNGSKQKTRAWEELKKARRASAESGKFDGALKEEILIAEGSDWFWWYDDFAGQMDFVFDDLFRMHLSNIYELSGRSVPAYIKKPFAVKPDIEDYTEMPAYREMSRPIRVMFVTSECAPYAKTGGLADVSGALPKALLDLGVEIRVIMPFYSTVKDSAEHFTFESRAKAPVKTGFLGFDIFSDFNGEVKTYFVGKRRFFNRKGLYGTSGGDYSDNAYRFSFFCKAVLSVIEETGFMPDIVHCNDWQSALIPFYLKFGLGGSRFENVKSLFTIHNMAYQGIFSPKVLKKCGIPRRFFNMHDLEYFGKLNFMKSGLLYSDAVNTVSERYAKEIMTPEYGSGLEEVVKSRAGSLYGINNGVDYSLWNPETDTHIKKNYSLESLEGKKECKRDLIERCGLDINIAQPLIGSVGRLAEQKGMDLFAASAEKIVALGCGIAILGSGSESYNRMFRNLAEKFRSKIFVCTDFDDELAHKIEAGADMFLMPSRYEPCGLNHMYSIKYGTIPIVRRTGGLEDVVIDHDLDRDRSNGFSFRAADAEELYRTVRRAVEAYQNKELWSDVVIRAMKMDFSWRSSALRYEQLYRRVISDDLN